MFKPLRIPFSWQHFNLLAEGRTYKIYGFSKYKNTNSISILFGYRRSHNFSDQDNDSLDLDEDYYQRKRSFVRSVEGISLVPFTL